MNKILRRYSNITIVFLFVMILSLFPACSGYSNFSSRYKELDFTFEYPNAWEKGIEENLSELVYSTILGPNTAQIQESPVKVQVSVWSGLATNADQDTQRRADGHVTSREKERNFILIKQEAIMLDGMSGYQNEFTYDYDQFYARPIEETRYIPTHEMYVTIPREGKVYEIWISASQNEWNTREKDIQHVLDTFDWK